jgi:hypothetical protein
MATFFKERAQTKLTGDAADQLAGTEIQALRARDYLGSLESGVSSAVGLRV